MLCLLLLRVRNVWPLQRINISNCSTERINYYLEGFIISNDIIISKSSSSRVKNAKTQLEIINSYFHIMQFKSILVAALAAVSLSAAAQDAPKEKFHPHWTLGIQGL